MTKKAKARQFPVKSEMLDTLDEWIAAYNTNHALARIVKLMRDLRDDIEQARW